DSDTLVPPSRLAPAGRPPTFTALSRPRVRLWLVVNAPVLVSLVVLFKVVVTVPSQSCTDWQRSKFSSTKLSSQTASMSLSTRTRRNSPASSRLCAEVALLLGAL